eukprot:m.56770 g.56770  ORF g.56770 m.56770 type:complete len:558 (-) comp11061_c0_seq3:3799-5472(-)
MAAFYRQVCSLNCRVFTMRYSTVKGKGRLARKNSRGFDINLETVSTMSIKKLIAMLQGLNRKPKTPCFYNTRRAIHLRTIGLAPNITRVQAVKVLFELSEIQRLVRSSNEEWGRCEESNQWRGDGHDLWFDYIFRVTVARLQEAIVLQDGEELSWRHTQMILRAYINLKLQPCARIKHIIAKRIERWEIEKCELKARFFSLNVIFYYLAMLRIPVTENEISVLSTSMASLIDDKDVNLDEGVLDSLCVILWSCAVLHCTQNNGNRLILGIAEKIFQFVLVETQKKGTVCNIWRSQIYVSGRYFEKADLGVLNNIMDSGTNNNNQCDLSQWWSLIANSNEIALRNARNARIKEKMWSMNHIKAYDTASQLLPDLEPEVFIEGHDRHGNRRCTGYTVDMWSKAQNLAIEVDGISHFIHKPINRKAVNKLDPYLWFQQWFEKIEESEGASLTTKHVFDEFLSYTGKLEGAPKYSNNLELFQKELLQSPIAQYIGKDGVLLGWRPRSCLPSLCIAPAAAIYSGSTLLKRSVIESEGIQIVSIPWFTSKDIESIIKKSDIHS